MVKPPKKPGKEADYENEVKKATPTASRHIFLIRHGQYDLQGIGDENRKLTELGMQYFKDSTFTWCLIIDIHVLVSP